MSAEAAHDTEAFLGGSAREEEEDWIRRSVDGDARAFRCIVEAHHRSLFHLAMRLVSDRAEAQDLVQESFAKAYVNLDRFDARFRLSTWLHRITLNTCRDHLKSARRRERASGADPAPGREDELPGPEEQLQQKRLAQRVRVAMDQLKPTYREVLVLKDMQGLSYQEIHAITEDPITALKIRTLRARAKLRAALGDEP